MMEDFLVQENKIKLSEAEEAKENIRAQFLETRARTKLQEKKEQQEAQAYAEKLIASLDSEVVKKKPQEKKNFSDCFRTEY